ncbi:MAG: c-type cytochrome [Pirellulaceae bacterium]
MSRLSVHRIRYAFRILLIPALLGGIIIDSPVQSQDAPSRGNQAFSPEASAKQFELHPDLKIELVACEPQVIDPVASAFDESGRLWVVEMRDYPLGPAEGMPPQCRIQVLRDRDGDGFFEHATTFAEQLVFPTGVQPWLDGVIVTLAGRVVFMKDTDGDDVCDLQEPWFEGFEQENTQLRANHPALMVNNRIHISNGLRGGQVSSLDPRWKPVAGQTAPISLAGKDFAFDAFEGSFEAIPGNGQFGFSEDDFGNIFLCTNRNPCKHVALDSSIIESDPWLTPNDAIHDAVTAGEDSRVYSIAQAWTTSNLHAGQFTAACGVHVFGGTALPASMVNNSFTCEPTGYLVQRQVMTPTGFSFSAKRGRDEVEFLASRDMWFRPVNLNSGPDGALYVVDMYRAVIEHPQFVPEELKNRPDQRWGSDCGRIWRITAKSDDQRAAEAMPIATFRRTDVQQFVAELNHPNRWHRQTSQRLILEELQKNAEPFIDPLKRLAQHADQPGARTRSLWLLNAIMHRNETDSNLRSEIAKLQAQVAEQDADARVRRVAAELLYQSAGAEPALLASLMRSDDAVLQAIAWRQSVTSAKQEIAVPQAVLKQAASDRLMRAYLMVPGQPERCIQGMILNQVLKQSGQFSDTEVKTLAFELARRVGYYGSQGEVATLFEKMPADALGMQIVQGLYEGMGRSRRSWTEFVTKDGQLLPGLAAIMNHARSAVLDGAIPVSDRLDAMSIVRLDRSPETESLLIKVFESDAPTAIRSSAVEGLASLGDKDFADRILSDPGRFPPALLRTGVTSLLRRPEWTQRLLDALEAKSITPAAIDVSQTNRLRNHSDKAIAARSAKLLSSLSADRQAIIDRYRQAMSEEGDSHAGKLIFIKQCAACHVVQGVGNVVGPDISDSRTKTHEQLLVSILNPNAAIDANYFRFTVVTVDGQVQDGLLVEETASAITLKQAEGKLTTINREDIEQARTTSVSLMPEGFEQQIDPKQMRDLIAYIKNWRYLSGMIPGVASRD